MIWNGIFYTYHKNVIVVSNVPGLNILFINLFILENIKIQEKVHFSVYSRAFLEPLKILWKKSCLLETLQGRWWWSDPSGPFRALVRELNEQKDLCGFDGSTGLVQQLMAFPGEGTLQ